MTMMKRQIEYACYHGDQFVAVGTADQLALITGKTRGTIMSYANHYRRNIFSLSGWIFFRMEDDDGEAGRGRGDSVADLVSDDRTRR